MKTTFQLSSFLLAVLFLMTACQDDEGVRRVDEGLPARLNLELKVPSTEKIAVTRGISDFESEVSELALIMFETGSGRKEYIDLSGKLTSASTTTTGGRTYNLTEDIVTLSGNYRLYAIANWSSPFCGISGPENLSEDELKEAVATNSAGVIDVTGQQLFPMSTQKEVAIEPNETNTLDISLRRVVSHIQFNFKNSEELQGKSAGFTPEYYQVFNLPKGAYLLDRRTDNKKGKENQISTSYINSEVIRNDIRNGSFDFYMLENVQKDQTANNDYADRDKWNGDASNKNFINAPKNGTYIVVTGSYNNEDYHGNVSYTFHLGDFSKANNNDYNNFTVNRNEYQTYSVTVKGVSSIITEVTNDQEDGGVMPGAEGNLTKAENVFVLDAHYETVMLKITSAQLTAIQNGKKEVQITSPKTNGMAEKYDLNQNSITGDFNWIQFKRPTSTKAFPSYLGAVTIDKFLENPSAYCLQSGNLYYVTAFIDEYFYEDMNPAEFVNQPNRNFILNPAEVNTSADGQSSVIEDYTFEISQRSIKTTYNMSDENINPFGIETWDETGAMSWNNASSGVSGLTHNEGYANTQKLINRSGNQFNRVNDWAAIGYLNPVNNNSKESHTWTSDAISNPVRALLARNRDVNGDGKITGTELKWYLPALQQYFTIWLGQDLLMEDTRLYDESLLATLGANMDKEPHLYTSSDDNQRLYWAEQGACYSDLASWAGDKNNLRAVRNLRRQQSEATFPAIRNGNVITVSGIQNVRATYMKGSYSKHNERDMENFLPYSFEVAREGNNGYNITGFSKLTDVSDMITKSNNYSQDSGQTDKGEWRVPNQRELMLMNSLDFLPKNTSTRNNFISSTWFTAEDGVNRHLPFFYDTGTGGGTDSRIVLSEGLSVKTGVARLVRDVKSQTAKLPDTAYENGGTAAGVQ